MKLDIGTTPSLRAAICGALQEKYLLMVHSKGKDNLASDCSIQAGPVVSIHGSEGVERRGESVFRPHSCSDGLSFDRVILF